MVESEDIEVDEVPQEVDILLPYFSYFHISHFLISKQNCQMFAFQVLLDPGPPPDYDTAVVIKRNNFFPNVIMPRQQYVNANIERICTSN